MAAFPKMTLTNVGQALQTKVLAGAELTFTRIALGDGKLNGQPISPLTALINQTASVPVDTVKIINDDTCQVSGFFSNKDIFAGFWWREMGIFALDPDVGEILYGYTNAGDAGDYIPPVQDNRIEKFIYCSIAVANADTVNITIPASDSFIPLMEKGEPDGVATLDSSGKIPVPQIPSLDYIPAEEKGNANGVASLGADGKIPDEQLPPLNFDPAGSAAAVQANLDTHVNNKNNPHEVTAAQLGVGKGRRVARFTVGTSTAGWTALDCDYLCDGTDDQEEINAAIQALPANGGEVVILDGVYNISAPINVILNGVKVSGNGKSTKLIRQFKSDVNAKGLIGVASDYCEIAGIFFDGNKNSFVFAYNNAIWVSNSTGVTISDCIFENNANGSVLISDSEEVIVKNNYFTGNTDAIKASLSSNIIIVSNEIYNNSGDAISLGSSPCSLVSNNISNVCSGNGIYISNSSYSSITGNVCKNVSTQGIFVYNSDNCTISGNSCNDNYEGIRMNSSQRNVVNGNTFMRGEGTLGDYTSSQYTIYLYGTDNNNNLISNNIIMGKNYVSEGGTGNTFVNNKYN